MAIIEAETKIRVRYAEVDRMGYVYYGNYAEYYEVGRRSILEKIGMTYVQLENDGYFLPIAKLEIKYLKPAFYDELLTVKTKLMHFSGSRIEFEYEIYNENGELINVGKTIQVFIDGKTRKPTKAPDYFLNAIDKFQNQNS